MESPMVENISLPDHSNFSQLLEAIGLVQGASEIHGVLCGMLCVGASQAHTDWIQGLFQDQPEEDLMVQEARQMLAQLYQGSGQQLNSAGMELALLLPADDVPLRERAQALVAWCEGFLYGLGMGGVSEQPLGDDAKEALSDISAFTRLDLDVLEGGESEESAFMELQEFLRVATLLIREELASQRERTDGGE